MTNTTPDDPISSVRMHKSTVERLKDLGRIGDSIEDIVITLLEIGERRLLEGRQEAILNKRNRGEEDRTLRELEEMEKNLPPP